jgi:hypothetical protein
MTDLFVSDAAEVRALAEVMFEAVRKAWPPHKEHDKPWTTHSHDIQRVWLTAADTAIHWMREGIVADEDAAKIVDARCTNEACRRPGHSTVEYRMKGRCSNCRAHDIIGVFSRGHEAGEGMTGPRCPICGCMELQWKGLA